MTGEKSRVAAGLLGIFLGGFGVHKFYLGNWKMGLLYLVLFWTFIPAIVGFIEGIYYLVMGDPKFNATYNGATAAEVARPLVVSGAGSTPLATAPHAAMVPAAPSPVSEPNPQNNPRFSARGSADAAAEILPGEITRAVGVNGTVIVLENKIVITRKRGVATAILHGMKGDKEIFLSKITSMQLRKPSGITRGYIQFELMGGNSSQKGLLDATQDENSVLLDPPQFEQFVRVKEVIENLMNKREAGHSAAPAVSSAQELKHWKDLLDSGTISQEEFDRKKKEILR